MNKILFTTLLLATNLTQAQSIYQCTDAQGKITFQQTPCPITASEQQKAFEAGNFISNDNTRATYQASQSIQADNDLKQLNRDIQKTQQKIDRLEQQRKQALAALGNKKLQARNNLAGATFEQSISTEMLSVNKQYDSQIQTERDYLKQLIHARDRMKQG